MTKTVKIAIAMGTALLIGGGGYLIYRRFVKTNEAARNYLTDIDDNTSKADRLSVSPVLRVVKKDSVI